MANEIKTSIVINLAGGSGGEGSITAEIDIRPDGLNGGRTKFYPGDSIGYLVFTDGAAIVRQTPTAGRASNAAGGLLDVEESLTFAKEQVANASKPITQGFGYSWLGLDGGYLVAGGGTEVRAQDGETIGIAEIAYQSRYDAFVLKGVPTGINEVLIVIEAEAT